jgi:2-keto-3-deoxy-L-rhamnonate aldolase RhmA
MKLTSILELLRENIVPVGMQCFTGDHALIEVMGAAGLDYVWLDSEHSAVNPRALEDTMRVCEVAGLIPLVRIPEPTDGTAARRAVEAGADGVIVPMVRSAADVRKIVSALTFPPAGERGMCPAMRVSGYSVTRLGEYIRHNNVDLHVIPMIETVEAVEQIDEICAVEQVKLIVFASGELSFTMGGPSPETNEKLRQAHQRVVAAAARHGVGLIGGEMFNATEENLAAALDEGVSVLCLGIDVLTFRQACERIVTVANAAVAKRAHVHRTPAPPSGFPSAQLTL